MFVINIEHIGDITANNLMEFAAKKAQSGQDFSADDIQDLAAMHGQVMQSLRLGLAVFLRNDLRAAQALAARKNALWRVENEASERHLRELRERRPPAQGGDVYLRILRDLKRIHSHLAALVWPALERAGLLQDRVVGETRTPTHIDPHVMATFAESGHRIGEPAAPAPPVDPKC